MMTCWMRRFSLLADGLNEMIFLPNDFLHGELLEILRHTHEDGQGHAAEENFGRSFWTIVRRK